MSVAKKVRDSDSPFIQRVATRRYLGGDGDVTMPDGARDIVIMRFEDHVEVMLTGNITHPIALDFPPGTEVTNIMFAPGTVFKHSKLAASKMLNQSLILPSAGKNKIWFDGEALEIPTFDNAEAFVAKLAKHGLIDNDKLVARLVEGNPMAASERTTQRRFLQATGLTYKHFTQIERAWKAARMLQTGYPAPDVAFALGYTDQPHMINSLKRILGQTPTEIAAAKDKNLPAKRSVASEA